jgi:carbonic anhydrase
VEVLKVNHVIVCGHYGCGGVKASMSNKDLGLINKWIRNIKDVYRYHQAELEAIADYEQRLNRLIELNVQEQVLNLAKTSIIQKAWQTEQRPSLHGWVYGLEDGLIRELCMMDYQTKLDPIYIYEQEG